MGSDALRIVQLVPSFVLGGAEVFATQLSAALADLGHDVQLLALRDEGPLRARLSDELAASTRVIPKRGRVDPTLIPRLAAAVRGADVVHSHLFTGLAWGTVAARLARVPVVVYTEHACHADDEAFVPPLRRALGRALDHVIACSDATRDAIARHRWFPGAPISVIPNGIPLTGRPLAAARPGPLRVGTVGRLVEVKGQVHLIDAVARLVDEGLDVTLTVWGEGPLRAELEARAAKLGARARLPGATDQVPQVLADLDVFVLPSLSEAMPITLLEAAAAGLPLVVTSSGGASTLLAAGAGGLVVPPADPAALADALRQLAAQSPEARADLGAASRRTVEAGFSIHRTAEAHVALYQRLRARR
jgi:glycosyltransferase involved in cell wall biosynthesis